MDRYEIIQCVRRIKGVGSFFATEPFLLKGINTFYTLLKRGGLFNF